MLVPFGVVVACAIDAGKRASGATARYPVWLVVVGAIVFFLASRVDAVVLRAFFLEAFKMPSAGMLPTLAVGDHFFIEKTTALTHPPRRGELVVFRFPMHREQDFTQRVIAVAGDAILVSNGHPRINGWEVPYCDVGEFGYVDAYDGGETHRGKIGVEFLEDSEYLVFFDVTAPSPETQGPWLVKDGEAFVMGDNRHNSHDSRMWFSGRGGGVPYADVRGHPLFVWMSSGADGIDWSREGIDLTGSRLPAPPGAPELASSIDKCMRTRLPRELTTPPRPAGR
jgi:signal peptidase I